MSYLKPQVSFSLNFASLFSVMRYNSSVLFSWNFIWFGQKGFCYFDLSTQNSQNFHFDWFLLCKLFNVWSKNIQRSYLSWHWRVMQNLKKNWLVAWKMTWGIWQIFTRALEVSKLELWRAPFAQSRKCMSLKFTEELCVMTMKNDAKFEEELTCRFKIDMGNWWILTWTLESLKNSHFNVLHLSKYILLQLKKG